MVLGGRPDHGGATDVDVLDALGECRAPAGGLLKGIEIDHQQIDGRYAVRLRRDRMFLVVPDGKQTSVHLRVQRLQPAVHHLGKASVLGHVLDLQPRPP